MLRFYGGEALEWFDLLDQRPAVATLLAHLLPRLQAEEEISHLYAFAAGTGSLTEDAHRDYIRGLNARAGFKPVRAARASLADLEAIGIPVEYEEG